MGYSRISMRQHLLKAGAIGFLAIATAGLLTAAAPPPDKPGGKAVSKKDLEALAQQIRSVSIQVQDLDKKINTISRETKKIETALGNAPQPKQKPVGWLASVLEPYGLLV